MLVPSIPIIVKNKPKSEKSIKNKIPEESKIHSIIVYTWRFQTIL